MRKSLSFLFFFMLLVGTSSAQSNKISGRVVASEDKLPLSGVTVSVKGKTAGTQTAANGSFSIDAAKGETIVISFIGYQSQEIEIVSSASLDIQLSSDAAKLGEVVVVGYGTQSRNHLRFAGGEFYWFARRFSFDFAQGWCFHQQPWIALGCSGWNYPGIQ